MEKSYEFQIKWDAKWVKKLMTAALCALAFLQLCLIFYANLTKLKEVVNWDSSVAIWHGMEMWRHHSLFLDGFYLASSLEIDTPSFLFLPIYFLTGNLGLAHAVGYAVLYVAELLICCDIFENLGKGKLPGILAVILIFTPYSIGELDWSKMLFVVGGQYSFRILTLLLLLDVLLIWDSLKDKRKGLILLACCVAVSFWTALSCGQYILLVEMIPLLIWFLLKGTENTVFRLKMMQGGALCMVLLSAVAGWRMHNHFVGTVASSTNNVITASEFWPNLGNCITGLLMLFGGLTNASTYPVFSKAGIILLIRCIFPLLALGLILFNMIYKKRVTVLGGMFLCIAGVNIAVLVFTHTRYGADIFEYRYHIVWAVMMLVALAELWEEFGECRYGMLFKTGALLVMLLLNYSGYKNVLADHNVTETVDEVLAVAKEWDCDTVYWYKEVLSPRQVRVLYPDVYSCDIWYTDSAFAVLYWGIYYDYADRGNAGDKNILVMRETEIESVLENFPQYQYIKTTADEWYIYGSETNPWDGVSGLPHTKTTVIDFPYSKGYSYTGALEDGGAVMSGENQDMLSGPGTEAIPGVYDIVISYENKNDTLPEVEVVITVDSEDVLYESVTGEGGVFAIKGVQIPEGSKFTMDILALKGEWKIMSIAYRNVEGE